MSLQGRHILITGASGLIGRALVAALQEQGAHLTLTASNAASISVLRKAFPIANVLEYNFQQKDAIACLLNQIPEGDKTPDAVVHCARSLEPVTDYLDGDGIVKETKFLSEFESQVIKPYHLSMLMAQRYESMRDIVFIGSIYGLVAANLNLYDNPESDSAIHYSVCKAALMQLNKEMALRLLPRKLRVNMISYGGVTGRADNTFQQRYAALCPGGRMLNSQELAEPLLAILSGRSSQFIGQNLAMDGGWSLW